MPSGGEKAEASPVLAGLVSSALRRIKPAPLFTALWPIARKAKALGRRIKEECLGKMIFFGQAPLRRAIT